MRYRESSIKGKISPNMEIHSVVKYRTIWYSGVRGGGRGFCLRSWLEGGTGEGLLVRGDK